MTRVLKNASDFTSRKKKKGIWEQDFTKAQRYKRPQTIQRDYWENVKGSTKQERLAQRGREVGRYPTRRNPKATYKLNHILVPL